MNFNKYNIYFVPRNSAPIVYDIFFRKIQYWFSKDWSKNSHYNVVKSFGESGLVKIDKVQFGYAEADEIFTIDAQNLAAYMDYLDKHNITYTIFTADSKIETLQEQNARIKVEIELNALNRSKMRDNNEHNLHLYKQKNKYVVKVNCSINSEGSLYNWLDFYNNLEEFFDEKLLVFLVTENNLAEFHEICALHKLTCEIFTTDLPATEKKIDFKLYHLPTSGYAINIITSDKEDLKEAGVQWSDEFNNYVVERAYLPKFYFFVENYLKKIVERYDYDDDYDAYFKIYYAQIYGCQESQENSI